MGASQITKEGSNTLRCDYFFGVVAQRLEQRTHNPLVAGSNPSRPTNLIIKQMDNNKKELFRAELVLLVDKYFGPVESPYDIQNAFEDYGSLHSEYRSLGENMVEGAKKLLNK